MHGFKPRIFRPRFRGPRAKRRWGANLIDATPLSNSALDYMEIVSIADYANNANLEPSGPMLARIRGYFTIAPTIATAFTVWVSVVSADTDAVPATGGTMDPSVYQQQIDEDILFWWSHRFPAAAAATPTQEVSVELDLKAKRRLKDTRVLILFRGTNGAAGNAATFTCNARALLIGNAST